MEGAFLRRTAAFTIAFLSPAAASFGQAPGTGAISGVVYDPSNRIVENAQVLGENNATHLSGAVATTSEGVFRLPLLPPDIYTVTVKAPGYAVSISVNLPFAPNGTNLPGWGTDALNRNTMFVLADTHVFNPNLVNIARFGYMHFDGLVTQENPLSAQAIGIGTPTGQVSAGAHLPASENAAVPKRAIRTVAWQGDVGALQPLRTGPILRMPGSRSGRSKKLKLFIRKCDEFAVSTVLGTMTK
jgi:hypothetical protein